MHFFKSKTHQGCWYALLNDQNSFPTGDGENVDTAQEGSTEKPTEMAEPSAEKVTRPPPTYTQITWKIT